VVLKLPDTEELDDEQVRKFLEIVGLFLESFVRLVSVVYIFWRGPFQSDFGRRVVHFERSSENLTVSTRSDFSPDAVNALHVDRISQ
jgi:hypothetical protein